MEFTENARKGFGERGWRMIWCQMRTRARIAKGPLKLSDVADVSRGGGMFLPCPTQPGVWRIDAVQVARALEKAFPGENVTMLGPDSCFVHREAAAKPDRLRWLRGTAAFLILLTGSALGLCWFHADVNMPDAQLALFRAITGAAPPDERWVTIPYAVGVALGVAVFYAWPGEKSVTPMEVRMAEYRADMEQTCARPAEDDHA